MNTIKNPCRQICKYDQNGVCIGCRRTMKEAAGWINFSDAEKADVMKKIEIRIIHDFHKEDPYDYYV